MSLPRRGPGPHPLDVPEAFQLSCVESRRVVATPRPPNQQATLGGSAEPSVRRRDDGGGEEEEVELVCRVWCVGARASAAVPLTTRVATNPAVEDPVSACGLRGCLVHCGLSACVSLLQATIPRPSPLRSSSSSSSSMAIESNPMSPSCDSMLLTPALTSAQEGEKVRQQHGSKEAAAFLDRIVSDSCEKGFWPVPMVPRGKTLGHAEEEEEEGKGLIRGPSALFLKATNLNLPRLSPHASEANDSQRLRSHLETHGASYSTCALPTPGGEESGSWRWVGQVPKRVVAAALREHASGGSVRTWRPGHVESASSVPTLLFAVEMAGQPEAASEGTVAYLMCVGEPGGGCPANEQTAAHTHYPAAAVVAAAESHLWALLEGAWADVRAGDAWARFFREHVRAQWSDWQQTFRALSAVKDSRERRSRHAVGGGGGRGGGDGGAWGEISDGDLLALSRSRVGSDESLLGLSSSGQPKSPGGGGDHDDSDGLSEATPSPPLPPSPAFVEALLVQQLEAQHTARWPPSSSTRGTPVSSGDVESSGGSNALAAAVVSPAIIRVPLARLNFGMASYFPNNRARRARGGQREEDEDDDDDDDEEEARTCGGDYEDDGSPLISSWSVAAPRSPFPRGPLMPPLVLPPAIRSTERRGLAAAAAAVEIPSFRRGGLRRLLRASPVLELTMLDERLDELLAPPPSHHHHRRRDRVLQVTWSRALERVRSKHEATPGARVILFTDQPSAQWSTDASTTSGGTSCGDPTVVDDNMSEEEEVNEVDKEQACFMLLLPPAPPLSSILLPAHKRHRSTPVADTIGDDEEPSVKRDEPPLVTRARTRGFGDEEEHHDPIETDNLEASSSSSSSSSWSTTVTPSPSPRPLPLEPRASSEQTTTAARERDIYSSDESGTQQNQASRVATTTTMSCVRGKAADAAAAAVAGTEVQTRREGAQVVNGEGVGGGGARLMMSSWAVSRVLQSCESTPDAALLFSWPGPSVLAGSEPGAVKAHVVCVSARHLNTVVDALQFMHGDDDDDENEGEGRAAAMGGEQGQDEAGVAGRADDDGGDDAEDGDGGGNNPRASSSPRSGGALLDRRSTLKRAILELLDCFGNVNEAGPPQAKFDGMDESSTAVSGAEVGDEPLGSGDEADNLHEPNPAAETDVPVWASSRFSSPFAPCVPASKALPSENPETSVVEGGCSLS